MLQANTQSHCPNRHLICESTGYASVNNKSIAEKALKSWLKYDFSLVEPTKFNLDSAVDVVTRALKVLNIKVFLCRFFARQYHPYGE